MTELVFSNSAYAGIKQAQGMGKNYCGGAFAVGFVNKELSAEQLKELSEKVKSEEEERCRNAVPLPRNEVCWIDPVLSFGRINNADFWDMRAKVYRELYYEPLAEDLAERNIIESKKNTAKLAECDDRIRIWSDHTPDSMCAMLFAAYILKDTRAELSYVELPYAAANGTMYRCWGEIRPYEFSRLAEEYEHPVTKDQLTNMADAWGRLCFENSSLRAVINNRVLSVSEDFYDSIIIEHVPYEPKMMGKIIAELVEALNIRDTFIAYRIKAMTEAELVETVTRGSWAYGDNIRRIKV